MPRPVVTLLDVADAEAAETVAQGIRAFNAQRCGPSRSVPLSAILRVDERVVGAVLGRTVYGHWLIEAVWVHEGHRGRGVGRQLLEAAESEALRRGVRGAQVDTLSFQAVGFYATCGFREVGTIPDFPPGHTKHYLFKSYADA